MSRLVNTLMKHGKIAHRRGVEAGRERAARAPTDRLEDARRQGDPGRPARHQHRADPWHGPGRGDQSRPGRGAKDLGRHGQDPPQRKDRGASPRASRERDLCPQGPGADALGRAPRIRRRSGPRRFHLRAALCAAPGDQRLERRDRSNASWSAATTRRSSSTSTSSRSSARKRCAGSTRSTNTAELPSGVARRR